MPGSARTLLLGAITAGLAVFVCVVLVEVGLRLVREPDRYYPYHPNSTRVFHPSPEITPGVEGPSYFSTNSYGARGPDPAGEPVRILTIGGSTTACTALDDSETWPALLMKDLNERAPGTFWVTNSGIDGKNSHHHLMHARYFLPKLPPIDYVIVYAGLNDVGMWLYVEDWDPHFLEDPDNFAARLAESFRVSNYTPPDYRWYKHLELWKRASIVKDRLLSRRARQVREEGRIEQDAAFLWMAREQEKRRHAEKVFVHRAKMETLPAALDSYARNLKEIAELIRAAGAEPIFMAQAMDHVILDEEERRHWWMGAMDGGQTYVKQEQMRELIQAFNARMREVAAEQGALFVDLPALLRDERGLFIDGHHFNEYGAAVTARRLADLLWAQVLREAAGRARASSPVD